MSNSTPILTFLGTGTSQGVPVITCTCAVCFSTDTKDNRTRSSVMFEVGEKVVVVDTGPDFRMQMLNANVKRLDAILFTHEHKDHVAGMDDIRAFYFKQRKPMPIYASKYVQQCLKREYPYIFVDDEKMRYPGAPTVGLNTINYDDFDCEGISITPIKVHHGKSLIHGFRVGDFSYITDASYIDPNELDKARGSKVLVLNALRNEPHHSHFTLDQALEIVQEVKPERAYLTHISHLLGRHQDVQKVLPSNVFLAYDGLVVE
ncbi:MAG: phosphoribosyl 1,2-cyclic phosphate phosphodiesterase [Granulosicoccus sp.]|jgi:phosphoribosyl 1,2-cyclic phosphate phosphodiesterase